MFAKGTYYFLKGTFNLIQNERYNRMVDNIFRMLTLPLMCLFKCPDLSFDSFVEALNYMMIHSIRFQLRIASVPCVN